MGPNLKASHSDKYLKFENSPLTAGMIHQFTAAEILMLFLWSSRDNKREILNSDY